MLYASDTSIILRLSEPQNAISEIVRECLDKLEREGKTLAIFPQVLIEFWTVATRPKDVNGLGMTTDEAAQELENLQQFFAVLPETPNIFDEWKRIVTHYEVKGKPTHDARIAAAMIVHKVESILTLNPSDFKRFNEFATLTPQQVLTS